MAKQQRSNNSGFTQESTHSIARVALYARVSTLYSQDPEMQLAELREYAGRRGWQIVAEFTDQGVSGNKESRPALNRLMADACRRRFDAILVWKIDRFGRSLKHLVNDCRTPILGGEVYASEHTEKTVYHTCKSRACPSCGYRATLLWQREQWAALPDISFTGIVLTMPDVLWSIFRENRHLLHDLPAVGAAVIQHWVKARYGVRVLLMVVPHTFGRRLNFNTHLHVLVSAVGLNESENRLASGLQFDRKALMRMWRYAVITYLRQALLVGALSSSLPPSQLKTVLQTQYDRWWNIDVSPLMFKSHFLRYAGRYVRRPPIAQRRFTGISEDRVEFWTKDLREKRVVQTQYSVANFVALLAEHVRDRYQHAIRYFGLLAPRSRRRSFRALFLLLNQQPRPRPRRLGWRDSLRKSFGVDPLVDRHGQSMHWVRRLEPIKCGP